MFCPNCGKILREGSLFCDSCGSRLEKPAPTPTQTQTPTQSPTPNQNIQQGYRQQNSLSPTATMQPTYPNHASTPAYAPPVAPVPPPHKDAPVKEHKPKSKLVVYLLLILIAILLIVAAVIIGMNMFSNKGDASDASEATDASVYPTEETVMDIDYSYKYSYFPSVSTTNPNSDNEISTYKVVKSDYTWEDANSYARDEGMNLVCINSFSEFNEVCALAEDAGINVFWVGAKRHFDDYWHETTWVNGDEMTYTPWYDGEPTYISEEGYDEEYLMVFKVRDEWYFNDAENDVAPYYSGKMGFIMEDSSSASGYYRSLTGSDKINLNTFLSNFSEAFFCMPYTEDNTYYEMLNFASNHIIVNSVAEVDYQNGKVGIPADAVDTVLAKFFGFTLPHHEIESSETTYKWTYSDGMYWHTNNESDTHAYFSIINDAYDNPDGTITVLFDVYYDADNRYDYPQTYWYSTSPEDAPYDYSYRYSGSARLLRKSYNGRSTYELIEYSTY